MSPFRSSHGRISRGAARWMAAAVAALQLWLLWTADDLGTVPPGDSLPALLWAWGHEAAFYPLLLLIALGPPLTWLACTKRGLHRRLLTIAWLLFLPTAALLHGQNLARMAQILGRVLV